MCGQMEVSPFNQSAVPRARTIIMPKSHSLFEVPFGQSWVGGPTYTPRAVWVIFAGNGAMTTTLAEMEEQS